MDMCLLTSSSEAGDCHVRIEKENCMSFSYLKTVEIENIFAIEKQNYASKNQLKILKGLLQFLELIFFQAIFLLTQQQLLFLSRGKRYLKSLLLYLWSKLSA